MLLEYRVYLKKEKTNIEFKDIKVSNMVETMNLLDYK